MVRLNAKSPPLLGIGGLLDLISGCCLFSGGVRRHVRHVVMMSMAMVAIESHTRHSLRNNNAIGSPEMCQLARLSLCRTAGSRAQPTRLPHPPCKRDSLLRSPLHAVPKNPRAL
jgi:hypothetical protein